MAEKSRNLISFLCQYCGQPLKLHFSFSKLNQNTYNQLLGLEDDEIDGGLEFTKMVDIPLKDEGSIRRDSGACDDSIGDIVSKITNLKVEEEGLNEEKIQVDTQFQKNIKSNVDPESKTTAQFTKSNLQSSQHQAITNPPYLDNPPPLLQNTQNNSKFADSQLQSSSLTAPSLSFLPTTTETTFAKTPSQNKLDSSLGFVLLGESEIHNNEVLSRQALVISGLFDLLSGKSDIDHPLCQDCTDCLLDQLDTELRMCEDEYNAYSNLLEEMMKIRQEDEKDGKEGDSLESNEELDEEIRKLEEEEKELEEEVNKLQQKQIEMKEKLCREKELQKQLDKKSMSLHMQYNEYKLQLFEFETSNRSLENQMKYTTTQLSRLKTTNIFNLTFRIWHKGHFGTINGLRLGRLPNVPVDWEEINAAWGQTTLLLHTLASHLRFTFLKYKPVPYGSQSYIETLQEKGKGLPLYGVGGFKFFWDTKFDQAMVAFLDCFDQFKKKLERLNSNNCLPYKMENGRVEDPTTNISYSIKIQFNSEEQWSKALKFMLTNLKWALVWVASMDG